MPTICSGGQAVESDSPKAELIALIIATTTKAAAAAAEEEARLVAAAVAVEEARAAAEAAANAPEAEADGCGYSWVAEHRLTLAKKVSNWKPR